MSHEVAPVLRWLARENGKDTPARNKNNGKMVSEGATRAKELQRAMDYFEKAQGLFLEYLF